MSTVFEEAQAGTRPVGYIREESLRSMHAESYVSGVGMGVNKESSEGHVAVYLRPATPPPADLVDAIAKSWDGCMYNSVGEEIDIGTAIRAEAQRLLAAVEQP